ncbi:phenylacetaldoxime dehydratase family protein [Kordiimonas pumila]|uniref:Phenylacetaldoxime dehydratase family protein n=1 Tax=Kordiimonas pumila TaxID=2161677 RepID=A0ABV7D4C5_9PROT|nr:phenylacetaldoxime dehydratase family protein [Kordiimonas pumila]
MGDHATIVPRRSAPPVNRPDGYEPTYDAFEPRFASHDYIVLVVFGFEMPDAHSAPGAVKTRLEMCLKAAPQPVIREAGITASSIGPHAEMHFVYWKTIADYEAWVKNSGIEEVFGDASLLSGQVGLWREICFLSLDHNETSGSRSEELSGIANIADQMAITPHHGYWGSARDRMVAAAEDGLASDAPVQPDATDGKGQRITVQGPENACFIRSSQDLSRANPEQKEMYFSTVKPALMNGLSYLKHNPSVSGCSGVRFVEEVTEAGLKSERSCVTGFFRSFADLENWTHNHPTHHAIMANFINMVQHWQGQPGLHLWHEITVFPKATLYGDYINCSAAGTLMAVGIPVLPSAIQTP